MKSKIYFLLSILSICLVFCAKGQKPAIIREYTKVFTTYPFSDPNPIPAIGKIYPYFRYDGFTDKPVQKEWKVVELENDYLKVMILPQIGGKIWAAIEKSTGKSFIYFNQVVKFRDVAMRGPWTSGGIEPNYGIIGHTPNCATPVDYLTMQKDDGSVSCVIGVLDLLTRTNWRLDINLPKDKAYLTTTSFWYNSTPFEQAYYTWMNTGIKSKGNLEFVYPGTHYLGHEGEYADWPINKQNGKNISFYESNNFGGPKSYHVFGKYTDFYGAYWHEDDFGMARYSTRDDKPGKKIWIWGLSDNGMIWEKLLTDNDGQYVEVQSGRFFNQADVGSTFTPFKHSGFFPCAAENWTEYWFPVKHTRGLVKANNYGSLNIKQENGWLKIYFCPLQEIHDDLKIISGAKELYTKKLDLATMNNFKDSIQLSQTESNIVVKLGENKLVYDANPTADVMSRPLSSPGEFDWNSVYGLYLQGEEDLHQRFFDKAKDKLQACLQKDPNFVPALNDMSMLMLQSLQYEEGLKLAKRALSINTYDPNGNYYYGLANVYLNNITDAKDGFDIAALDVRFRTAAYTQLSKIYFRENNLDKAVSYAEKSLDFNRFSLQGYQLLSVIYRLQKNKEKAESTLAKIRSIDPLNHFVRAEEFIWNNSDENRKALVGSIRNELPQETFTELASWYHELGRDADGAAILALAPQTTEVLYWQAYLKRDKDGAETAYQKAKAATPLFFFPFRAETEPILKWAAQKDDDWKSKYYLGLLYWQTNNLNQAKELFSQCGTKPDYAPFYAARANLFNENGEQVSSDLQHAIELDKGQWRYQKLLAENQIRMGRYAEAMSTAEKYYQQHPQDYIMGMLYVRTLLLSKKYKETDALLAKLNIIPFEGATDGRELYREAKLMQAVQEMQKKNYAKALQFIAASKLWPSNLGVGKPYDEDIDLRLEEWMSYLSYTKSGKTTQAQSSLERILQTSRPYPSANDLVTAWAMEKVNGKEKARQWLQERMNKYPDSKILLWVKAMFENKPGNETLKGEQNATVRILEELQRMEN